MGKAEEMHVRQVEKRIYSYIFLWLRNQISINNNLRSSSNCKAMSS